MKRNHGFPGKSPVLLAGRQGDHQHPLRLLEILAKGFCPVIIRDRVDTRLRDHGVSDEGDLINCDSSVDEASSFTQASAVAPNHSRYHCFRPENILIESPSTADAQQRSGEEQEMPFELRERLPSDIMGVSRKILDGFCSNCHFHNSVNTFSPAQHVRQPSLHHHRGICSVLVGQYRALCLDDRGPIPGGEESSVSTVGSLSVDLSPQSPQSSPAKCRPAINSSSASSFMDTPIDVTSADSSADTSEGAEEDDYDEPLTEFEETSSHRGKQVFLATILAMYITFTILQQWSHTNHHYFLFKLQPKQMHSEREAKGSLFGIHFARKEIFGLEESVAPTRTSKNMSSKGIELVNNCTILSAV